MYKLVGKNTVNKHKNMEKRYKAIITNNPKIKNLYEEVKKELKKQGKELRIFPEKIVKASYLGQTIEDNTQVLIIIDDNLTEDKYIAVLIHELGEAHYIANKLPKLKYDEWDRNVKIMSECITHYHINRVIEKFNLQEETQVIRNNPCEVKLETTKWINFLRCLHERVTWEGDSCVKGEEGYKEISSSIDQAVEILDSYDTMNIDQDSIVEIEEGYKKILEILKELGYTEEISLISRL